MRYLTLIMSKAPTDCFVWSIAQTMHGWFLNPVTTTLINPLQQYTYMKSKINSYYMYMHMYVKKEVTTQFSIHKLQWPCTM